MANDQMFEPSLMNKFYTGEPCDDWAVAKAWFSFCCRFLICVNGKWLQAISKSNVLKYKNMYLFISISDEAFTRWCIEIKTQQLINEKNTGRPEKEVNKGSKKPNGSHDSNKYSQRYAEIYYNVKKQREKNEHHKWNNMFWTLYRLVKPDFFGIKPKADNNNKFQNGKYEIPGVDDEENNAKVEETTMYNFDGKDVIHNIQEI
jgi:hypothetical protein